jgi:hypothetical protein
MMMIPALLLLLFPVPRTAAAVEGPCDIFQKGGTPCVAAHSVVRALYASFDGPLYAVRKLHDNVTLDIKTLGAGGVADTSAQDAYCDGTAGGCTIAAIYDQSGRGNHLRAAPARRGSIDLEVNASVDPLTLGGATHVLTIGGAGGR